MPTLTVPARIENLAPTKAYLQAALPKAYAAQAASVLLVAEELLVNVFSYAYPEGTEGEATLSLDLEGSGDDEALVFTVRDWGEAFNPFEEVPVPDLTLDVEGRPMGGLGIYLIKQVSEAQSWKYENGSNVIRIVFGREPKMNAAPDLDALKL